jgi:hypothetical protein
MSPTSRSIGHLFPPQANSIDSVKEGGESAALDSLEPSRRASISVDGYGASILVAIAIGAALRPARHEQTAYHLKPL